MKWKNLIFNNKKAQTTTITALINLFASIVIFIGFFKVHQDILDFFFTQTSNIFLRVLVMVIPAFYLIGSIFGMIRTLRGGS